MTKVESAEIVAAINKMTDGLQLVDRRVKILRPAIPLWATLASLTVNALFLGLYLGVYFAG